LNKLELDGVLNEIEMSQKSAKKLVLVNIEIRGVTDFSCTIFSKLYTQPYHFLNRHNIFFCVFVSNDHFKKFINQFIEVFFDELLQFNSCELLKYMLIIHKRKTLIIINYFFVV